MLFLIESLLLKSVASALKQKVRTKKHHLFVEEFRLWCTREVFEAAEALIRKDPASLEAMKKIIHTALIRLGEENGGKIKPEDIEHIHDLLLILVESESYLCWGERREFI